MEIIEKFKKFELMQSKLVKILGGGGEGPRSGASTGVIPSPPGLTSAFGSLGTIPAASTNPNHMGAAAMLVGGEIHFGGSNGNDPMAHEAAHVSQSSKAEYK